MTNVPEIKTKEIIYKLSNLPTIAVKELSANTKTKKK